MSQTWGLKERTFIYSQLWRQKFKIKGPPGLLSGEASVLGLRMAPPVFDMVFPLGTHQRTVGRVEGSGGLFLFMRMPVLSD